MTNQAFTQVLDAEMDPSVEQTVLDAELEPITHIVILVPGTTDPVNSATVFEKEHVEKDHPKDEHGPAEPGFTVPMFKDRPYNETLKTVDVEDPNISFKDKKISTLINSFANETYWLGYPDFLPTFHAFVDDLAALGDTVHLIENVRWSGDNNDDERRKGGQHLVDLLLKTGAQYEWTDNATKQALKEERVFIHLMGHSHGGNVINSFTESLAEHKPEKWSVKTVVYLSTPFFNSMHKVNETVLHENCQFLNVYNKFDLTQRVIADYTVKQLEEVEIITKVMTELLAPIKKMEAGGLTLRNHWYDFYDDGEWNKVTGWPNASWVEPEFENEEKLTVIKEGYWNGPNGPGVWQVLWEFFKEGGALHTIIKSLTVSIDKWAKASENELIDPVVSVALSKVLGAIDEWRKACFTDLDNSLSTPPKTHKVSDLYATTGYGAGIAGGKEVVHEHFTAVRLLKDLNITTLISHLATLLGYKVEKGKQSGDLISSPLLAVLDQILVNILKKYDNTMFRPTDNISRPVVPSAYHKNVTDIDVTTVDPYYNHGESEYKGFVQQVESIQKRYAAIPDNKKINAISIRQEFLFLMMANAVDFGAIDYGWAVELIEDGLSYALSQLENRDDRELFNARTQYIRLQRKYFSGLMKRNSFQLISPKDAMFKMCIMLINNNPRATTVQLLAAFHKSPIKKKLFKAFNQLKTQLKISGIAKPKFISNQYSATQTQRKSDEFYLIEDLLNHWPKTWYKPNVHFTINCRFHRVKKYHSDPGSSKNTKKATEVIHVPEDRIRGSVPYLAQRAHSISRNRLHYGPDVYQSFMRSCRTQLKRRIKIAQ